MTYPSNAEVSIWHCHNLSASHHHSIQELSWILSGILLWGSLCCLVHGETWSWKNSKEECLPLHHCWLWLSCHLCCYGGAAWHVGWWGSWFCPLDLYCCLCWPLTSTYKWCERFSWQNQYFPNGLERNCLHGGFLLNLHGGHLDDLERSWILCCGHHGWLIHSLILTWKVCPCLSCLWICSYHRDDSCCCPGGLSALTYNMYWNVFISTLVTFPVPGRAFSWQVRHFTLATCLTIATLGFVPITFPEFEGFDLINGGHLGHSSIGLVSVEVLDGCLMLLGMFQ